MSRKPGDHLVPFRDHVLNREVQIRESRQGHADGLFGSLGTYWQTRRQRVIDVVGGEEFIDGSQLFLVFQALIERVPQAAYWHLFIVYYSVIFAIL
jgi:hypothetical protein